MPPSTGCRPLALLAGISVLLGGCYLFQSSETSYGLNTPARKALEQAFAYPDATIIFFLSDGQPTDSSAADILAQVRSLNAQRHLVVSTVGLGADQDEKFLSTLAAENGGHYVKK